MISMQKINVLKFSFKQLRDQMIKGKIQGNTAGWSSNLVLKHSENVDNYKEKHTTP